MQHDGLRRAGWAVLAEGLWLVAKGFGLLAWLPTLIAEAAATGSARAHFRSLPDPVPPSRSAGA